MTGGGSQSWLSTERHGVGPWQQGNVGEAQPKGHNHLVPFTPLAGCCKPGKHCCCPLTDSNACAALQRALSSLMARRERRAQGRTVARSRAAAEKEKEQANEREGGSGILGRRVA